MTDQTREEKRRKRAIRNKTYFMTGQLKPEKERPKKEVTETGAGR